METFGSRMRQAMEEGGLRPDDVAQATGLEIGHVQALLRDDFGGLPGKEIVEGLRAFARIVHADPDEVIADYSRERAARLSAPDVPQFLAGAPRHPPRRSGRAGRAGRAAFVGAAVVLAAGAFLLLRPSSGSSGTPRPAVAQVSPPRPAPAPPAPPAARPAPPVTPAITQPPVSDSPAPPPALPKPAPTSGLSVPDHGVGRGIAGQKLVGRTSRFSPGERVWFWSRIEGGKAGDRVAHVWLHEGKEALRVPMRLGGTRWRTRSYKGLRPGSEGRWAVEVRDAAGRVLARSEFVCRSTGT
jgi:hypothetical protein